jgi:hypothetical protein
VPTFRSRLVRGLLIIYPWVTLFAIIVTANHYWLDALGGAWALLIGYGIGSLITKLSARFRLARARRHIHDVGGDEPGTETEAALA